VVNVIFDENTRQAQAQLWYQFVCMFFLAPGRILHGITCTFRHNLFNMIIASQPSEGR